MDSERELTTEEMVARLMALINAEKKEAKPNMKKMRAAYRWILKFTGDDEPIIPIRSEARPPNLRIDSMIFQELFNDNEEHYGKFYGD